MSSATVSTLLVILSSKPLIYIYIYIYIYNIYINIYIYIYIYILRIIKKNFVFILYTEIGDCFITNTWIYYEQLTIFMDFINILYNKVP